MRDHVFHSTLALAVSVLALSSVPAAGIAAEPERDEAAAAQSPPPLKKVYRWDHDPTWRHQYSPYHNFDPHFHRPPSEYRVDYVVPSGWSALELDVSPTDATVSVDGIRYGRVERFDSSKKPLVIRPGRHVLELRAEGRETVRFEVVVASGQLYELDYKLDR